MSEYNNLNALLEQFTFWRLLLVAIMVTALSMARKFFEIWIFLRELRHRHKAKTLFRFPIGFPQQLEADPNDSFSWNKACVKENPKCRLLASHFGTRKMVFLLDPILIKDFLSDQSRYKKSEFFGVFKEVLGKGLFFSEGKVWKKHRKLISETFRFEFIASQIPTISRVAKDLFEKEFTRTKGKNVNILELFQRITGELVFQIFFGADLIDAHIKGETPTKYLSNYINVLIANLMSPENILFGLPGIKLKLFKRNREIFQMKNDFNQFIIRLIEERKKRMNQSDSNDSPSSSSKVRDFLGILLETQKQSQRTEDEFTDEEVLYEFITFFAAGMDTTGHLLAMATYYYYQLSSEVQEAVIREAEFLATNTAEITPEKLNKVETIVAFMKETLRKGGPTPIVFDREAIEDHFIGDVKIPKGAMINCSFTAINHNSEYYKNPENFNLYRWIPGHDDFETQVSKNPFIFTPFSAGPRNCIGQHLAMMEAKIIFSIFITNFKFTIPEDYKMRMKIVFLYEPRDPIYIDVETRNTHDPKSSFKCI